MSSLRARLLPVIALAVLSSPVCGQSGVDPFTGLHAGLGFGPVSYNTQITFDGVDDPAGRGGIMYTAFVGLDRVQSGWLVGGEVVLIASSVPDPYTFDPATAGFAELDLRRGTSIGVDGRAGRVIGEKILVHMNLGYAVATQSVRFDGVPLPELGGADHRTFGTLQYGGGVEIATGSALGFRFVWRALGGSDLSADDFTPLVAQGALTFFDVEPSQHHFVFGARLRL